MVHIYYLLKKTEGNCKLILTVICVCLVNSVYFLTLCGDPSLKHARWQKWKMSEASEQYCYGTQEMLMARMGQGSEMQSRGVGMAYLRLGKIFSPGENLPFLLCKT